MKDNQRELNIARKAIAKEWGDILGRLWTAFGKEIDKPRLTVYARQLRVVPLGLLEQSVDKAIRDQEYNTPPTVHKVFSALKIILGDPSDLDFAIAAWAEAGFERCILKFD